MSTWTKIRDAIEGFFTGPIWDFIKPLVHALESAAGPILIAAAESAVLVGFATPGSGSDKMAAALKSFESEIVAKGLPFLESQARALIELAYQRFEAPASAVPVNPLAVPPAEVVAGGPTPSTPLEAARATLQVNVNTVS